ncbi:uncharacterized protein SPSC_00070 [Sporisorium scitamineum]|uniref:Uncharacterized protein n=1 Tax=Sporisorium scitamineum TaxID=49012 RepID=A0A0F7S0C5_9BASI|nr:hypothetical protein [Sporisorium scitamineum]CDS81884.1 uncharacterized protein SPSC_00070 [Sporisorium scitamineum]
MRLVSFSLWSLLISIAILPSSVLCVQSYKQKIEIVKHMDRRYMQEDLFPSKLKEILSGRHAFHANYPHATVHPILSVLAPSMKHVVQHVRENPHSPRFFLLGEPYPGHRNRGFSAAFPIKYNNEVTGNHLFAFISVDQGEERPRLALHGFADVVQASGLENDVASTSFPGVANIEVGDVLSTTELFRNIPNGWPRA